MEKENFKLKVEQKNKQNGKFKHDFHSYRCNIPFIHPGCING